MVIVPAWHGLEWIRQGWQLFVRSPMMWILALFGYWLLMALAGLVPYLGPLAATLFIPAFAVSFMTISRELDHRRPFEPGLLFSGFRSNLPMLVTLGGVYLALTLIILALTQVADGGVLMRIMLFNEAPPDNLAENTLAQAGLLAAVMYIPVVMAFWFAPVLVAWRDMGVTKALFYSFFACLRNWRAFAVYGLAWTLLATVLPGLLITLLIFLLSAQGSLALVQTLVFGYLLILMPTLFASFYSSYREIFGLEARPSDPKPIAPE